MDFLKAVIEKGRIAQWIICAGGVTVCLIGGIQGWFEPAHITNIFLAMVAAVFGIESMSR